MRSGPIADRFHAKYIPGEPDQCWEWLAGLNKGYGCFGVGPRGKHRTFPASRYALALAHGLIDADGFVATGLHALHTCDNRRCVNPNHLYWGTNSQNIADRIARERSCTGDKHWSRRKPELVPRGERGSRRAKLTTAKVLAIREAYEVTDMSQEDLARWYGVSRTCIQCIVERKTWRHV